MECRDLRIALIGVGNMGKKYAAMITSGEVPHMKLSAVVIRKDELMEWGRSLINVDGEKTAIFRNTQDLFNSPDLYDAVIIATPHKTHRDIALEAFRLKKDVLCDKPAAADIGEAEDIENAATDNDCIYGIVFHQRLYAKYRKLKELIDSGAIGIIKRCVVR